MIVVIGVFSLIVFAVLQLVFTLIGLIKAVNNEHYDLPLTIEIMK